MTAPLCAVRPSSRCTGRASLLLLRVGGPPGDRTPNPRIKRERVSRSRCAELRKHAQHKSLGAHRFHLYYTVTRHKTCHVSGGYISAAIRARRKNIIYATCSAPAMSGASTRELMRRMGHASMRAALIYQHASDERDRAIADFNDLPMFLIDSRTRPGQSGSPVIFFSSGPHISAHVRLQVHPCPVVSGGQKRRSHRSESKVPTVDRGWSPFQVELKPLFPFIALPSSFFIASLYSSLLVLPTAN